LVLLFGVGGSLWAQDVPASTFQDLRAGLKLRENETIEVTDPTGFKYKAKVFGITDRTMVVTTGGVRRELTESDVREIRYKRPDGLGNGMGYGLLAGLGAATAGVFMACGSNDSECQTIAALVFFPTFAGAGIGAGALIDAAIRKNETVFARPSSSINRGFTVAPIYLLAAPCRACIRSAHGGKTAGISVKFGF